MTANGVLAALTLSLGTVTAACLDRCETTLIAADTLSRAAPPADEPVFDTTQGDALILREDANRYTTPVDVGTWRGCYLRPFYPDQSPLSYFVINPGRGGSGKALRLVYLLGAERLLWKTNPEDNHNWYAPADAPIVVQYWFRISKNGGPGGSPGYGSTAVGMKCVEFWRVGMSDRTQFGPTGGGPTTGPLWSLHSGGSSLIMGYQPVGPYWNQLNNNQWHRATYLLQPASAPGATDGVARMWVDGTKIIDISAAAAGVTPSGGTKVWSTLAEVAHLDTYKTGTINLGEYMNGRLGDRVSDLPMTLDFDDFMWWSLPKRVR